MVGDQGKPNLSRKHQKADHDYPFLGNIKSPSIHVESAPEKQRQIHRDLNQGIALRFRFSCIDRVRPT